MINETKDNKIPEEYKGHFGKEVRITLANGNTERMGVFYSYDNDNLYLLPSVISEPVYNKNKEPIHLARIEKERPLPIRRDLIGLIDPLREGYIENFVNSFNSYLERIIIP